VPYELNIHVQCVDGVSCFCNVSQNAVSRVEILGRKGRLAPLTQQLSIKNAQRCALECSRGGMHPPSAFRVTLSAKVLNA
jgi:hypothetical protein